MALNFRDNFGQCTRDQVINGFEMQQQKEADAEEFVQSQLQFLRIATASVICFKALAFPADDQQSMSTFGCNLGLSVPFLTKLR